MAQFSIIPTEDELKTLERDLRFHPTVNPDPLALTKSQVEHFNDRGFIAPISIFDTHEITAIRNYFDGLLAEVIAAGGDSYSISSAHLKYGPVFDLLKEPRITNVVADLIGENIIGWGSHFFCKLPKDGKAVAWHQDASYWPLSPSKAVTVWLAIDDADRENACVKFIAGSHHVGHLTYRPSDSADHNVLSQSIDNPEQYGEVIWDELKAGQISIHSDLLLHGSEANESSRRRCGLTLRYCSAEVRAAMRWNEKGVFVRGHDASGHWSNRTRP